MHPSSTPTVGSLDQGVRPYRVRPTRPKPSLFRLHRVQGSRSTNCLAVVTSEAPVRTSRWEGRSSFPTRGTTNHRLHLDLSVVYCTVTGVYLPCRTRHELLLDFSRTTFGFILQKFELLVGVVLIYKRRRLIFRLPYNGINQIRTPKTW